MKPSRWLLGQFLSVVGLALAGCQSPQQANSEDPRHPFQAYELVTQLSWQERVLQAGDELSLTFFSKDERVPAFEGSIQEDGAITLPLIGVLQAAGKTPKQLQEAIRRKYEQFPRLRVVPPYDQTRGIYVGGEVKQPDRQVYVGATSLSKAIQTAGGFTQWADQKKVKLTRADGRSEIVNFLKIVKGSTEDPPVYPGDKIEVPRKWPW